MDNNEFDKKCRKMVELREAKEKLKDAEKELNAEIETLTVELTEGYEKLNKAGPIGIKDLKKKLIFKQVYRAKVTNNDELLEWLDGEGMGDVAKRRVDWRSLDKLCNERSENGDEMPKGVEGFMQPQIAVNKL